ADTPLLFSWWMLAGFFGLPLGLLAAKTERGQPVELKIVYSATAMRAPRPSAAPPPKTPPKEQRPPKRTPPKGQRRRTSPLTNKGRLRLLPQASRDGEEPRS